MQNQIPPTGRLKVRKHPHLMELNTLAWLGELSRNAGQRITLAQVPAVEWDRLKKLGFDLVWLMGIWKRSATGRAMFRTDPSHFPEYDRALPDWHLANVSGSPYSIQDYSPDPRLGDWDALDWARNQLRQRGMGLILDFVPNHTGPDHPWLQSHPEYYIQGSEKDFRRSPSSYLVLERDPAPWVIACGKDPYLPPWADTAQLNHFNPETREALADTLRSIARHADGLRCDMAMLAVNAVFAMTWGSQLAAFPAPPLEFWPGLIASQPNLVWIAEVYWDMEWQLQQMGFQFTYDKRLYDRLRSSGPPEILAHLRADVSFQARLARFLENHDEDRCAAVFAADKLQAAAALLAALPGMRFYHQGQLEGRKIRLPIVLDGASPEPVDSTLQGFYLKLLEISNRETFHEGEWSLLDVRPAHDQSSGNLIGCRWDCCETTALTVVNFTPQPSQGRAYPAIAGDRSRLCTVTDLFRGDRDERIGTEIVENGIYFKLEGFGYQVLEIN
jgi:hypothetical protein